MSVSFLACSTFRVFLFEAHRNRKDCDKAHSWDNMIRQPTTKRLWYPWQGAWHWPSALRYDLSKNEQRSSGHGTIKPCATELVMVNDGYLLCNLHSPQRRLARFCSLRVSKWLSVKISCSWVHTSSAQDMIQNPSFLYLYVFQECRVHTLEI